MGKAEGYGRLFRLAEEVSRRGAEDAEDQLPGSRCLIFTVARMAIVTIPFSYCFSAISAPLRELTKLGHEKHEESQKSYRVSRFARFLWLSENGRVRLPGPAQAACGNSRSPRRVALWNGEWHSGMR